MISTGAPSARTEVLLDLQALVPWCGAKGMEACTTQVPGTSALRMGQYKLIHGHAAIWKKKVS